MSKTFPEFLTVRILNTLDNEPVFDAMTIPVNMILSIMPSVVSKGASVITLKTGEPLMCSSGLNQINLFLDTRVLTSNRAAEALVLEDTREKIAEAKAKAKKEAQSREHVAGLPSPGEVVQGNFGASEED